MIAKRIQPVVNTSIHDDEDCYANDFVCCKLSEFPRNASGSDGMGKLFNQQTHDESVGFYSNELKTIVV